MLFATIVVACGKQQNEDNQHKIKVVCTTNVIGDLLHALPDSIYDVFTLMGPGVDPHLYKLGQNEIQLLSDAEVIVANGFHLEGKMQEMFDALKNKKKIVSLGDFLPENKRIRVSAADYDPHIWFDVENWIIIWDSLQRHFPELKISAPFYRDSLVRLHEEVKMKINTIDSAQKVLITAHDAFHYFGNAYGVEVKGIQGISTLSEAGLKDIVALSNMMIERKIGAVFVETSVNKKSVEALIQSCLSKNHLVIEGGELFSDALGAKNKPEGTYIGMFRHNVNTIVKALKHGKIN
jgi:manganese/zinc/iron transport system substrate-binding protein